MPKNNVTDLITDQEIAFALLVLSGSMTDREAAHAAGLNPDTAAYTKAKPRVRAYMLEHRAAMEQKLLDLEAESQRRLSLRREQVLDRLWEISKMSPEMTRGSITGQVKALSMIVAIEGLIPDRRAGASNNQSTPPPTQADIYPAAWQTNDRQPDPALAHEQDEPGTAEPQITPGSEGDAPPPPFVPSESVPASPSGPAFSAAPDIRVPFFIKRNPFARGR
jgi:hypothetical protein